MHVLIQCEIRWTSRMGMGDRCYERVLYRFRVSDKLLPKFLSLTIDPKKISGCLQLSGHLLKVLSFQRSKNLPYEISSLSEISSSEQG